MSLHAKPKEMRSLFEKLSAGEGESSHQSDVFWIDRGSG
jgi:hypothetical protein